MEEMKSRSSPEKGSLRLLKESEICSPYVSKSTKRYM